MAYKLLWQIHIVFLLKKNNSSTSHGQESLIKLLFYRTKGHGIGCTTALSGCIAIFTVCYRTPPTSLCSDNTPTCTDQQWYGFQDSARIQDQRSMRLQHTKHFDLGQ